MFPTAYPQRSGTWAMFNPELHLTIAPIFFVDAVILFQSSMLLRWLAYYRTDGLVYALQVLIPIVSYLNARLRTDLPL